MTRKAGRDDKMICFPLTTQKNAVRDPKPLNRLTYDPQTAFLLFDIRCSVLLRLRHGKRIQDLFEKFVV